MKWLVLLTVSASFSIACGSPAASQSTSTPAKTNVNAANNTARLRTENAYTFAQNSDLGRLAPSGKSAKELVGKTVSEIKLWENKTIDLRLKNLMGAEYSTMRKFWNVETPIKKFGDFLMMTGCEKNNCAENQYVMFMDMGAGTINVIHIGKGSTREWKYDDMDLPPPFEEALAKMKSHE